MTSKFEVVVSALHAEATVWERQGECLEAAGRKVAGLRLNRCEAGIFQLLVSPYNELINQIDARCREGHSAMAEIVSCLQKAAHAYENNEQDTEQLFAKF